MAGISDRALQFGEYNRYRYNGKEQQNREFSDSSGLEWYDYGARMYDEQIGVWHAIDPLIEKHYNNTPYGYVYNDPIRLLDENGLDSAQRAAAIREAWDWVNSKAPGNQYQFKTKGTPGKPTDCSGLVSDCITAGGESDPNVGKAGSGVLNIQNHTQKIEDQNVVAGSVVTFYIPEDNWPYHIAIVIGVNRDPTTGEIVSLDIIQSSSGKGPNETTVTIGQGKLGKNIQGYYKWDTKPDEKPKADSKSAANSGGNDVSRDQNNSSQSKSGGGVWEWVDRIKEALRTAVTPPTYNE